MARSNGLLSKIGSTVMIAATAASLGGCGNEGLEGTKQNIEKRNAVEKKLSKIEADNKEIKDAIVIIAQGVYKLLKHPGNQQALPSKRAVSILTKPSPMTNEQTQRLELLDHEKRIRALEKAIENLKAVNKEQSKKLTDSDKLLKELNALKNKLEALGAFDVQRSK